ncbi:hypothetical protein IscW_ISCW008889 [Ixodes scapularis]|uniref:Uncharacterized protein n=1 Tax=Ixodes scapularis TaxID=6945 RepID=B7Q1K0_IXOSC|nr:hypothetical protein IscW_ISCW008889 [Ixodes scapularis]|eukprot:XP_002409731.1 hypothetical protein IscW_ISCW008889 [Ixodes scapularis]
MVTKIVWVFCLRPQPQGHFDKQQSRHNRAGKLPLLWVFLFQTVVKPKLSVRDIST